MSETRSWVYEFGQEGGELDVCAGATRLHITGKAGDKVIMHPDGSYEHHQGKDAVAYFDAAGRFLRRWMRAPHIFMMLGSSSTSATPIVITSFGDSTESFATPK